MNILILGHGKSGTTIFVFKVAAGLPNCQAFSGGDPVKRLGDYENAVYKHTYNVRKGRNFDLFDDYSKEINFDRKIWMARDPRDVAVSEMLYRWHKGHKGSRKQFQEHLAIVQKKEMDPESIPFHVVCRYSSHDNWPITTDAVIEKLRSRYQTTREFVKSLGNEWFIFRYEDMINKNFDALHEYLGFEIDDNAQIPSTTKKKKVARKKAMGDWRHWFTEEDVELFKPALLPYMELIGYDCTDWALDPNPEIDPQVSSLYMKGLARQNTVNNLRRYKLLRPFIKPV
ncbi:MAG: hypothetical protein QNJ58_07365 [Desulfobacterales bacterium]|nr:hypothetical protein [Desulfobacterales bacterium]